MRGFILLFLALATTYFYLSVKLIKESELETILEQTKAKAQKDFVNHSDDILADLKKCYPFILAIIGLSSLVCFIWILLLKFNAKIIVWLSIFSLPILTSIGLFFSIRTYLRLLNSTVAQQADEIEQYESPANTSSNQDLGFEKAIQTILTAEFLSYAQNDTLWLVISIILTILLIILVILMHFMRKRVSLSIALIGQASKAINGVKSSLIFPIIPRTIGLGIILYGLVVALLIIAGSHHHQHQHLQLQLQQQQQQPQLQFQFQQQQQQFQFQPQQQLKKPPLIPRSQVWKWHAFNLFAILWILNFISAISQTTLAGAFSNYYWTLNKPDDVPYFAITLSFARVIRYHLSDIAFGSFLMATIKYLRIILEFIANRFRKRQSSSPASLLVAQTTTGQILGGGAPSVAQTGNCFLRVFFWFLDRFLKYIDRNAYIMMSMYHKSYLESAKSAVKLLYKNSVRALVLDYVTYFVLLISRVLITGLAAYASYQFSISTNLRYQYLPIVIVTLGTYFISKGLFSVYSMAVDTLFVCFLIESNYSDGSLERPYYMSKELRKIFKKTISK